MGHRLEHSCHKVMYSQLRAFVTHGVLIDPHEEFFVKIVASKDDKANTTIAERGTELTQQNLHP